MTHPLSDFFNPSSIAVIGASANPGKWGHYIAKHTLLGQSKRRCYLVNPAGGEILDQPVYPSLDDLPESPEFVALAVPAHACESVIERALSMGTRGFMIVAGGFSETSAEGTEIEFRILSKIKAAGARLFGPNCIGLHDAEAIFHAGRILYPCGSIGLVSQSGVIAHDLSRYCATYDTGFSRVINLGNQTDVALCESIASFSGHTATKALIVYCEDLLDGRQFINAISDVVESGIPVILLTIGASEAAAASALSHTGALVSDIDVVDAACEMAGAQRVSTIDEAFYLALAHATCPFPVRGARVGILSDGGGLATLAAETLSANGLSIPVFSTDLRKRLTKVSGNRTITGNPVDLAGEADQDLSVYQAVAHEMLHSGEIDVLFFSGCLGYYANNVKIFADQEREVAKNIVASVQTSRCPSFIHTLYPVSDTANILHDGGLPVFRDMGCAARALAQSAKSATAKKSMRPKTMPQTTSGSEPLPTDYWSIRHRLVSEGIPFPGAEKIIGTLSIEEITDSLGFPVVLKATHLLHKSDQGGIVTGIHDSESLHAALKSMKDKFGAENLCLEQECTVSEGVELMIGIKIDQRFGPVITVGLGGIYVEIFKQVSVALAPTSENQICSLIESLPGSALLMGVRGKPRLNIKAASAIGAKLANMACQHRHLIESIEINPLLVLEDRAVALDARVIPNTTEEEKCQVAQAHR